MQLETGNFHLRGSIICPRDRYYPARVVIPIDDFPRLEFGSWEKPDECTPCLTWCHDNFGIFSLKWESNGVFAAGGSKTMIYFADYNDALMFVLRWSA